MQQHFHAVGIPYSETTIEGDVSKSSRVMTTWLAKQVLSEHRLFLVYLRLKLLLICVTKLLLTILKKIIEILPIKHHSC